MRSQAYSAPEAQPAPSPTSAPIPEIRLSGVADGQMLAGNLSVCRSIAGRIVSLVADYPHFAVLRGLPATEGQDVAASLCRLAAEAASPDERLSFTRVEVNDRPDNARGVATAYSRTSQALDLHTDSSFADVPHDLIAFQMVRAATDGGVTTLATIDDLVTALDPETDRLLRQSLYPFGKRYRPVLETAGDRVLVRYYRQQLDAMQAYGVAVDPVALRAMAAFDAVLARESLQHRFRLMPGEILFIHNRRVLHGRTAFAEDSRRLMYRFRIRTTTFG